MFHRIKWQFKAGKKITGSGMKKSLAEYLSNMVFIFLICFRDGWVGVAWLRHKKYNDLGIRVSGIKRRLPLYMVMRWLTSTTASISPRQWTGRRCVFNLRKVI